VYYRSISNATNERDMDQLCTAILTSFDDCLSNDLSLLRETAGSRVSPALGVSPDHKGQSPECLSYDLILKMCALAVLSSHTLRSLGKECHCN